MIDFKKSKEEILWSIYVNKVIKPAQKTEE